MDLLCGSEEQAAQLAVVWSRCHPVVSADLSAEAPQKSMAAPTDDSAHEVTCAVIEAGRGRRLMFHAAGLADPDTGRSIGLIAPSGTGKTTAVATLGRRFGYLTDETVIVDPSTLTVTAFPKPLSVLGASGRRPKTLHSPDALGLLPAPDEPRLHALLVLDRDPHHAGPPRLDTLPLDEALRAILPQTSSVSALDRGLVQLCEVVTRLGGIHRLRYAEAESTGELISTLLAQEAQPVAQSGWHPVPDEDLTGTAVSSSDTAGTDPAPSARIPLDDAVHLHDGALALLHQEKFTLLTGIGPAVWDVAGRCDDTVQIITELSETPDAPSNAGSLAARAVEELIDRGLLLRR